MKMNPIQQLINDRKVGKPSGIYAACTANELVLEAVLEHGKENGKTVLIEATANQCNQFGGYTGMTPNDFKEFVFKIADKVDIDKSMIVLGGDHLGPLTWQGDNEAEAMEKSKELVKQYVLAGFTKIHIDTSMRLADDCNNSRLSDETIARRAAVLAKVCEDSFAQLQTDDSEATPPVYVIGSEVPIPGGAQDADEEIQITTPEQFKETYNAFKLEFDRNGLTECFKRVVAIVVQPGVEFGDEQISEYNRAAAKGLIDALKEYDGIVFEGHSTDYQTKHNLKQMANDGIAILKVGPALTYYFREAVFALNEIEKELGLPNQSEFKTVLERVMVGNPENWIKHYHGTEQELAYKRKYSLSDRCRYYLPNDDVKAALQRLIGNINSVMSANPPISILSQYMPTAYERLREKGLPYSAENLIKARVKDCIDDYTISGS